MNDQPYHHSSNVCWRKIDEFQQMKDFLPTLYFDMYEHKKWVDFLECSTKIALKASESRSAFAYYSHSTVSHSDVFIGVLH